jgi:hypothetical protein
VLELRDDVTGHFEHFVLELTGEEHAVLHLEKQLQHGQCAEGLRLARGKEQGNLKATSWATPTQ